MSADAALVCYPDPLISAWETLKQVAMGKNWASTLREHIQVNFEHVHEKIFKTVDTVNGFPCNSRVLLRVGWNY